MIRNAWLPTRVITYRGKGKAEQILTPPSAFNILSSLPPSIRKLCIEPRSIGTNGIFVLKTKAEPKVRSCSLTSEYGQKDRLLLNLGLKDIAYSE